MKIIKANGEEASYDREKITRSLERAGASSEMIQGVLEEAEKKIYEGIRTKALYKIIFRTLKKLSHSTAGKYHLKNAIMELGPTGFPFEKFIAALLEAEGYQTHTNQIIEGRCIKHEVDIIAEKEGKHFVIECKFHSNIGNICDVKVVLYVHARFLDVEKIWLSDQSLRSVHEWLVTNTRMSSDAEKYGKCVGMTLISWNFPKGNSLRERIDRHGLYPITCLTTLAKQEKQRLLDKMIVLCHDLYKRPFELNAIGLSQERKNRVLEEVKAICKIGL